MVKFNNLVVIIFVLAILPELEKYIDMALVDGVITEDEKAFLIKKADQLGVEKDEFDFFLDAKIQMKQKEFQESVSPPPPKNVSSNTEKKSLKEGEVIKCPSCGEVVGSFLSKCSACDHEFRGKGANKTMQDVEEKLAQVTLEYDAKLEKMLEYDATLGKVTSNTRRFTIDTAERNAAISNVILKIPVPSTKEDLLEMISFCQPQMMTVHAAAYTSKYKECMSKLKLLSMTDRSLLPIVEQFEKSAAEDQKKMMRILAMVGIPALILITLIIILTAIFR